MKKTAILLVFLFSLASAQFIDYEEADTMYHMRGCAQGSTVYYVDQPVRYYLETDLSLPTGQGYRFLSGAGSPSDLLSGDNVCEGDFHYGLHVHAMARNSGFEAWVPSVSGASTGPNAWTDCDDLATTCPEGDVNVYWSNSLYNSYSSAIDCYGAYGPNMPSDAYARRSMHYRESGTGPFHNDEVVDVATLMKGTTLLRRGTTTIAGPYTLTGTEYNGPITILGGNVFSLTTGSYTQFSFTQRVNVDGGLVATDNVNANDWEDYWAFTETGSIGSQDPYDETITSSASTLNVYDEDHVGIIDPYIVYVDVGSDGFVIGEGPYEVTPGQSVPVTIRMYIPNRPSNYYALPFEFYNVNLGGTTGATFTETSGINQCSMMGPWATHINGGWVSPHAAYTSDIKGNLQIPDSLPAGTHQLPFSVSWRSCSGYHDCDGDGYDEETPDIFIEIEIPSGDLPDLTCEIEPIEYVDGIAPGPSGFGPGQGVESWEVTITNIGTGDAEIDDYEHFFCSMMWFQAWSSDDTPALNPAYINSIVPTFPGTLASGASTTFVVEDATAICVPGEGDAINAISWVNLLALSYPACSAYYLVESDYWNNQCTWNMACDSGPGEGECELIPTHVSNPPSGHLQDFELFCGGVPCTGPVGWDEQDINDDIADTVASTSLGATAQVITYATDENVSGTYLLTATVGYPNNMVCNATIVLVNGEDGPGNGDGDDHCFIIPPSDTGSPGSFHEFDLYCVTDSGTGPCSGYWSIIEGDEYVGYFNHGSPSNWADVGIATDAIIAEEAETVEIQATSGSMVCYAEIVLPPMDCLDFI